MAPFSWCCCPRYFQARCNCISAFSGFIGAFPAKTLFFDWRSFRFSTNMRCRTCSVGFTKRVSASNKCYCFFVVHSHSPECFSNIDCRSDRIRIPVGTFRVHINQSHLNRSKWVFQLSVARIALVFQPFLFGTPINIFFRFPNICSTTSKTKRFETHGFQGNISCEHH